MLEIALRSSVILAAAWGLTRLMPRAAAATRHLVWHVALVAVTCAPLLTVAVPSIPVTRLVPLAQLNLPELPIAGLPTASAPSLPAATSHRTDPIGPPWFGIATLTALGTLGSLATAFWFAAGWVSAVRLRRRAHSAPLAWQLEVNALRDRLRIDREVTLGVIDEPSSPLATGVFRAAILLPRTAAAWSADRRRAVLLHELAHIKRRDCRVQMLAQAACAMYWFNPLVWLAVAQLRRERERACDDEVLRCGAQASSYAAHLLDIARELRPRLRPSAALAMARPSELEGRLLAVLAVNRTRVPSRGSRWLVVAVLAATTVGVLGASTETATENQLDFPTRYVVANDVATSGGPAPEPRAEAEAVLHSSDDPHDRELATLALAFTSGRDVIPALLQALNDSDAQVREKAAIGLALRRDERVVEPLIAALSDPDAQVREKAAIALGTTGDPRARDALTLALNDPDAQVREKAAAGLILSGLTR
jgi:beta-lactamase regulating signal transducer with metallopeptidase domain